MRSYHGNVRSGACPTTGMCFVRARGFLCSTAGTGSHRAGTCLKGRTMVVWYRR